MKTKLFLLLITGALLTNCSKKTETIAPQLTVPVLSTTAPGSITFTTATSGGNITSDGGAPITERGVCYSTTANPTTANTKITDNGKTTGNFISSLTGLTPNTAYHIRAYATNSVGTAYGSDLSFTTSAQTAPILAAPTITNRTSTSATIVGTIISDGGATITSRQICYNLDPNLDPGTVNFHLATAISASGFTYDLTNLKPNTTYYVRTSAFNGVGDTFTLSAEISFTTLP